MRVLVLTTMQLQHLVYLHVEFGQNPVLESIAAPLLPFPLLRYLSIDIDGARASSPWRSPNLLSLIVAPVLVELRAFVPLWLRRPFAKFHKRSRLTLDVLNFHFQPASSGMQSVHESHALIKAKYRLLTFGLKGLKFTSASLHHASCDGFLWALCATHLRADKNGSSHSLSFGDYAQSGDAHHRKRLSC